MTETLLALDPGGVTGWSTWLLDDDVPLMRADYGLIKGGLRGMVQWMSQNLGVIRPDVTACEKFNLDKRTHDPDLTPVYIEGALVAVYDALGIEEPEWQATDTKAMTNNEALRRAGLWIFPREAKVDPKIMHRDADDVHDTYRHALGWARLHDHMPTVEMYWPDV